MLGHEETTGGTERTRPEEKRTQNGCLPAPAPALPTPGRMKWAGARRLRWPGSALCAAPGHLCPPLRRGCGTRPTPRSGTPTAPKGDSGTKPGLAGPGNPSAVGNRSVPAPPSGPGVTPDGGPALGPSSSFPAASRPPGGSGRKQEAPVDSRGVGWWRWQGRWQMASSPRCGRVGNTPREARSRSLVGSGQWTRGTEESHGLARPLTG